MASCMASSTPYRGIVHVHRPSEPVALAAPRSTKASSALAQEAKHQDMRSMLQSTLDDFAQEDAPDAPTPVPKRKSRITAAASAEARVLRNT